MADAPTLSIAHVRQAVGSIRGLAVAEGRTINRREQGAIAALLGLVQASSERPKPPPVRRTKPATKKPSHPTRAEIKIIVDRLPVGLPVKFKSAGRGGKTPSRDGTVVGHHESTRGLWIVVAEEGAVTGVVVRTRPALVKAVSVSSDQT